MIELKYFKTQLAYDRQHYLCDEIMTVLIYTIKYCESIGINPVVTETVTTVQEDKLVNRVHDQHRKRVAFDLRVKDWTLDQINQVEKELDEHFKLLAYVTASGKKEIALCHDSGAGKHFHVAVNAKYKLNEFTGI